MKSISEAFKFVCIGFSATLNSIYVMGGTSRGVGNEEITAEFNFFVDPEAAYIVLDSAKIPVVIVPWETCGIDLKITMVCHF